MTSAEQKREGGPRETVVSRGGPPRSVTSIWFVCRSCTSKKHASDPRAHKRPGVGFVADSSGPPEGGADIVFSGGMCYTCNQQIGIYKEGYK